MLLTVFGAATTFAQNTPDIDALDEQYQQLIKQKRYVDAVPVAEMLVQLQLSRFGEDDPNTITAIQNLD